jgi:hypothetical protein
MATFIIVSWLNAFYIFITATLTSILMLSSVSLAGFKMRALQDIFSLKLCIIIIIIIIIIKAGASTSHKALGLHGLLQG